MGGWATVRMKFIMLFVSISPFRNFFKIQVECAEVRALTCVLV